MPIQYHATMARAKAQATLFNTYTTAKTVINASDLWTVPAGWFEYPGQRIQVRVSGGVSHIVTTPGTVTFQIMMGSIVAWTSGAIQMTTTAGTLMPFQLDVDLTLRAIGAGTVAKFLGIGHLKGLSFTIGAGADPTVTHTGIVVPVTAPALGTGWDSTIANVFDFWAGFSISNAGNGIQVEQYHVIDS